MAEEFFLLKIGELAARAGLSIRALHHYDAIGLLSPSVRTDSGARRYGQPDMVRLHRILALKQLGYSLTDIRATLDDPGMPALALIERQIHALEQQQRQSLVLLDRLAQLAAHLRQGQETATGDWLNVLELMTVYQRHFTEGELRLLRNPEGRSMEQLDAQWAQLVNSVEQAMHHPCPTDSPQAHALAWRWIRLVIAKTSNNPVLANKLRALQQSEQRAQQLVGISPAMLEWIGQAMAHARTALFAKHLPPAQVATIRQRQLAAMADMDAWPSLLASVRAQMEAGTAVDAAPVQALMRHWQQLFCDSYCGDDADLEAQVRIAFAHEPDLMLGVGVDDTLMRYVRKAQTVLHQQGK